MRKRKRQTREKCGDLGGHNTNRFSVVAGEVIGSSPIKGAPDGSMSERPAGLVGLTR